MRRSLGLGILVGIGSMLALSNANAFTLTFSDTNAAPTSILFSGPSNGVTLTARITFEFQPPTEVQASPSAGRIFGVDDLQRIWRFVQKAVSVRRNT